MLGGMRAKGTALGLDSFCIVLVVGVVVSVVGFDTPITAVVVTESTSGLSDGDALRLAVLLVVLVRLGTSRASSGSGSESDDEDEDEDEEEDEDEDEEVAVRFTLSTLFLEVLVVGVGTSVTLESEDTLDSSVDFLRLGTVRSFSDSLSDEVVSETDESALLVVVEKWVPLPP